MLYLLQERREYKPTKLIIIKKSYKFLIGLSSAALTLEMNPDQPFYLLDDGTQPIPPLFYPMLNRCLAVPVLPEWSTDLWVCGRERGLITLLDKGEGQGYASWKVKPDSESWEQIVSEGLHQRRLAFGTEPIILEQPAI